MAEQKEILESIRDIISGQPGDDDILDLTKKLNDDGSVSEIKPAKAEPVAETRPEPAFHGNDVLKDIDSLLSSGANRQEKDVELEFKTKAEKFNIEEEFSPLDAIAPREETEVLTPAAKNNHGEQKDNKMDDSENMIISNESAEAAKSSIAELTGRLKGKGQAQGKVEPSAPFRNGETVEDLVVEMLKPMMKDWLDKNLPKLVNEIVQKEIQKLIPRD